jgi:subtilase family serine protease
MKHKTIRQGAQGLILAFSLVAAAAFAQGNSAQNANWRAIENRTANSQAAQFQQAANASDPVSITVVLKLNNESALDSYVAALHTPGNASYHKWLSKVQVAQNFAPTVAQAQAVVNYLRQNGFTNVQITTDNYTVTATGTVAAAQQAFNTQIGVYSINSHTGFANMDAIQVPAGLSQVDQVLGLDTVTRAQTLISAMPQAATTDLGTGNGDGYYPDEFATVYNRPSGKTGGNTTAAIVGWGSMVNPVQDLQQFEAQRGIFAVPTSIVSLNGSSSDDSEQKEWAMDAQTIVGISGGVKQLIFYTAGGTNGSGGDPQPLYNAVNQAVIDNTADVINMSWGACEDGNQNTVMDNVFKRGIAQGQLFVAASGDSGAYSCGSSQLGVLYPASSPYVTAVGGTTLSTTNLVYGSEKAWSGSGGGNSNVESKPYWQTTLSGSGRQVPDLAFDADPSTGGVFYYTASADSGFTSTGWTVCPPPYSGSVGCLMGGTSLAAPLFVGAWAVLQSANNNTLGFAPSLIYPSAAQLQASAALHDIMLGNNDYYGMTGYSASPGYDNVTGFGSFDITKMLAFVDEQTTATTYTITASAGIGGVINPSGITPVNYGANPVYTISPSAGYRISSIDGTCDGMLVGNDYMTNAITGNCTITVSFTPTSSTTTYLVTSNVDVNTWGTISPANVSVSSGATTEFTVIPSSGYYIAGIGGSAGGCTQDTLNGNIATTGPITGNCTVMATFLHNPTVTANAGTGGTIAPAGAIEATGGIPKIFTVTPDTGYKISSVGGTCGGTLNGNTYTTNTLTLNCTVTASFTSTP